MPSVSTIDTFMKAYDELSDAIFRHCYFRVYDRERAKELMQECFTRTWEYIAGGRDVKNLKAFLYRVANNLIVDHARKKKPASLDELIDNGFAPGDNILSRIEANIDARQILSGLQALDEKQRQVLMMRYVDELGPKEIAEIIGESENVVSVRLHRGLKQLRAMAS